MQEENINFEEKIINAKEILEKLTKNDFTLSDSLTKQIQKQLSNIFPSQLISLQTRNNIPLKYQDLVDLKNNTVLLKNTYFTSQKNWGDLNIITMRDCKEATLKQFDDLAMQYFTHDK